MKNGEQASYTGQHGTMYTFMVAIEGGPTGQVSSKSPAPYRFRVGDEVDYTFTPPEKAGWTGRMKVEKPKDQGGIATAPNSAAPQSEQRSSGWSPAKEASVMFQGFIKSIIESGAPVQNWDAMLAEATALHDANVRARVKAMAERALANVEKMNAAAMPVAAPVAQAAPAAQRLAETPSRLELARAAMETASSRPTPTPLADMPEDDLPF